MGDSLVTHAPKLGLVVIVECVEVLRANDLRRRLMVPLEVLLLLLLKQLRSDLQLKRLLEHSRLLAVFPGRRLLYLAVAVLDDDLVWQIFLLDFLGVQTWVALFARSRLVELLAGRAMVQGTILALIVTLN